MVPLSRSHHVDTPHIAANHCHDVAHVGAVHGDAVATVLEVVEHQGLQVHPLLGGDGVVVLFLPKSLSVTPPYTQMCTLYNTRLPYVIASE